MKYLSKLINWHWYININQTPNFIWILPVFPLMSFLSVPASNPGYHIAFGVFWNDYVCIEKNVNNCWRWERVKFTYTLDHSLFLKVICNTIIKAKTLYKISISLAVTNITHFSFGIIVGCKFIYHLTYNRIVKNFPYIPESPFFYTPKFLFASPTAQKNVPRLSPLGSLQLVWLQNY